MSGCASSALSSRPELRKRQAERYNSIEIVIASATDNGAMPSTSYKYVHSVQMLQSALLLPSG